MDNKPNLITRQTFSLPFVVHSLIDYFCYHNSIQRNIVLNFQIWSCSCCLAKVICIDWASLFRTWGEEQLILSSTPNSHPLALSSSTNRTGLSKRTGTGLKKRFAIVLAKYFGDLCWKTISVHNCTLVLSLKTTILYIFTPENKIYRNIALKNTKYEKYLFYL